VYHSATHPFGVLARRSIHDRGDPALTEREDNVPKYLLTVSYSAEGMRGLLKEGGSSRRKVVQGLIEGVGGRLESFYYAFGEHDAIVIADLPTQGDGLSLTMAVNASGAVRLSTTPLISPEEVDAAAKKGVAYRAPGA
jgi:uncharacterized protein with GYD domain